MITITDSLPLSTKPALQKRAIAAITVGNALEFYDFVVYSMLATTMSRLFFPVSDDLMLNVLLSFGVFGVGFIARPIGGIVIGLYADRYGRRYALRLTLWLMAIGALLFIVAPTYAQAGMVGPILVILARLVQGFAVGGQVGAATTMLMEYADNSNRGYYCSWQLISQNMGLLAGALIVAMLTFTLSAEAMDSWGWRIVFGVGILTIPVGEYIRHKLEETATIMPPSATEVNSAKPNVANVEMKLISAHLREIIIGVLLVVGATAPTFIITYYMANYAVLMFGMPLKMAIWASCTAALVQIVLGVHAGKLGDRFGRRPVLIYSRILMLILIYPAIWLCLQYPTFPMLLAVVAVLSVVLTYASVASVAQLPELFPRRIRVTGMSIVYCIGVMLFGGFAQFIVTGLIQWNGDPMAPAYYVIVCEVISLIGLLLVHETAGKPLD